MDDLYNWKPDAKQAEASNRYLNAAFDAAPEAPPERSLPGEMASGLKRGLYITAPQMIGGAMKALSPVDSGAYRTGMDLQESAKAIAALPEMQRGATSHGMVGDTLVAGAEGIGQMAPVLAGGLLNPALGAGIAGTMYGGSTYQDTKERVLQREGLDDAYAAAHPDDARVRKAKLTGLATGTVQGVGDAAMSYLGGRFLKGAFPSLGKQTAQGIARGIASPGRETLKRFGTAWGAEMLGEGITEAAQDEGQAAIERAAGLKDAPAFGTQALDSAQGGVGMAMLLGPLAAPGHYSMFRDARQVQRALVDPSTDPAVRTAAARVMGNEIAKVDQSAAANFLDHAHDAIGDEQQTGSAPYALNLDDTALLEPFVRTSNPGPSSDDSVRQFPAETPTPPGTSLVAREPASEPGQGGGIDDSSPLTLNASPGVAFDSDIPDFASPLAGMPPRQTSLQPIATPGAPVGPLSRALALVMPDSALPEARPIAPQVSLRGIAAPVIDAEYSEVRPALPAPPSEMDKAQAWAKDEVAAGRGLGLMQGYGTSDEQHAANILTRYRKAVGGDQGTVPSDQAPVTNAESPVTVERPSLLTPDASPSVASPLTPDTSRSKRRQLDPTKDDLVVAMAKLGGLDLKQAKEQWGTTVSDDAKELNRHAGRASGMGLAYAFKSGGIPLDRMREALVEHGYLPEGATINDLADAVHAAARGSHTYSNQADVETLLDRAEQQWMDRHDFSQALELTARDLEDTDIPREDEQVVVECYRDVADVLVDLFDELHIESYDDVKQLIMEVRHEVRSTLANFTDAQEIGTEGETVTAGQATEGGAGTGQAVGDQREAVGGREQRTESSEQGSVNSGQEAPSLLTPDSSPADASRHRRFLERMLANARTERGRENWRKRLESLKAISPALTAQQENTIRNLGPVGTRVESEHNPGTIYTITKILPSGFITLDNGKWKNMDPVMFRVPGESGEKQSPEEHVIVGKTEQDEGSIDDHTRNGGTGQAGLERNQSGRVSGNGAGQRAGRTIGGSRATDQARNGHPDVRRSNDRGGSVGGKPESVHLPDSETAEGSVQPVTPPVSEPRGIELRGDNPGNYRITADTRLGEGSRSDKIRTNLDAIRLLKQLEAEQRYPTRDEQHVLARYVGWGGLKSVFDPKSQAAIDQKTRQELESLLTKEEYFEARQSVLNAHYTSQEIIGAIYSVLDHMGFSGGNVLEPTYGSGNFIGLMPEHMAASSKWYGSELDPITARIGQHLYPDAQLLQTGFQNAEFPYGKFDLVIGNPPFGAERITDSNKKRSDISGFKIHNYVIAKSGMHLRPGGVMAMVVTSRFLDTADPEARNYLAKQFKFLGAIRLPNDAFVKNAGTEVTTDLVFFQKLMPGEYPDGQGQGWLTTGATMTNASGEEVTLNKWFAARPELMLGEPSMKGTMYGGHWRENGTGEFTLNARPGQDTAAELAAVIQGEAFDQLRDVFRPTADKADAAAVSLQVNREDVGIGGYFQENGQLFMRQDDDEAGNPSFIELTAATPWTEKQALGETRLNRIKGMLALRESAYDLINAERFDLPNIELRRKELNEVYDEFVKKYGFISDSANASLMADDVKIESGLEVNYRKSVSAARAKALGTSPSPAKADKASILKQRVFFPVKEVTSAGSVRDGYNVSLSERGRLDLEYIASLTGTTLDQVTKELAGEGLIFRDPESGEWRQEDEYLSGNVKAKLRLVEGREGFENNVEALKKALPADVPADEIFVDLGATWVPEEVYREFADLLGIQNPRILVSPETGMVKIVSHASVVTNDMNVLMQNEDYGIAELFNAIANKQALVAYDPGEERGSRVVNKERTKALAPIGKRMSATFRDWIMADPIRAAKLAQLYNDTQNTHAPRRYSGEHLKTVGANPAIRLRNSQRNAAWRMIQSPVTLLDHVVGAGKTFTIITGVMERRRLGLSRKPMIVVPNHLVGQWAADFLKLYPGARILAATKKDFEKKNRRRLFARIATGNFDAVIVGHSSFGFIPVETDTQREILMEEIGYLERALHQATTAEDKRTVRNITERIAKKREKIGNLMNRPADNVITFENMGIDNLVIDEAHEYKNLEYSTSMQNITGMGNPKGAKKSFDLYAKIQYLRGKDGAVTFATGTPISNSLVEMYTILRYLNRPGLKARGLDVFDSWAKMYALIEPTIEYTASQKLKERQVMTTFDNLPAMLQLYTEFADVISMKDLKRIYAEQIRQINKETGGNEREEFPVPAVKNGGRYLDVADPTPAQKQYMEYLVARADRLERLGGQNDPKTDNHLWLMNDARKMALDIRLVDPLAPGDQDNKVNRAARNIKRLYDAWHADKGAQLVFCDLSTPIKGADKAAAKFIRTTLEVAGLNKDQRTLSLLENLDFSEQWQLLKNRMEGELDRLNESADDSDENDQRREKLDKFLSEISDEDLSLLLTADSGFSVYDDLKRTLVGMGIKENEIAFIHDANNDKQKDELFARVNSGDVRVLIGSSKKMGAGTNAQERLVGLHHMDAPWRPSDVEQREGRIIRQGNKLYERDPENFQVEIPAYSTRQTFDAVMWQILARKAGMLDDFRSGTKRLTEEATDSANYAEFMAESTGNPIFREKFKLEKEIDELESTQRSVAARRMAAERIVRDADRMLADEQREVNNRKRDLDEIGDTSSFQVDGKEYADDLSEAYNRALAQYRLDFNEYETRLLPDYIAAKEQIEAQDLDAKEKAAALKQLKKPSQPVKPSLARLARTSRAAAAAVKVSDLLDDIPERGEVEFFCGGTQVVVDKQPGMRNGEYDFRVTINGHRVWDLGSNGLKRMSEAKLLALFSTGAIKAEVHAQYQRAIRSMQQLKASIDDAQLTMEKVQFKDGARLDQMRERYQQVVDEVNNLEQDLAEKREQNDNRYISGDRGRFGSQFSAASESVASTPAATIEAALKSALKSSRIPIRVVQSLSDLPRHIQIDMRLYGIEAIDGVFDPRTNVMYLVADYIPSVERARELLRHEWFHAGVADKELEALYRYYSRKDMARLERIADERGFDLSSRSGRLEAAGELAAQLAETNPRNFYLARIVVKIKEWLRALGIHMEFGQAEVARIIRDAIQRAQTGPELAQGDRGQAGSAYSATKGEPNNSSLRSEAIPRLVEPVISSHTSVEDVKKHPDYVAAKAGHTEAAFRLVSDLVNPSTMQTVKDKVGEGAIFVAPHAEEMTGRNQIPMALAGYYANATNGSIDAEIIQTNQVHHTGADAMQRLISRPVFDGDVVKNGRYVLVDDATTLGGTLAELAHYIISNGGKVEGVVTLTNAMRNAKVIPNKLQTRTIERRYGDEIRELFHIDPNALTAPEASYLIGFKNADELRKRVAKARQERSRRLLSKGIRTSATEESLVSRQKNTPEDNNTPQYSTPEKQDAAIADHAAKIDAPGKVATMTTTAFELAGMHIPQKLKASIGTFLSNPWFGSEGKPIRRTVVNLNIQRSHVRNEIISDLFRASEGYTGVEGLHNILEKATTAELKQFNELIKYGDRNDVAKTFTRDELYRGKTPFGKLSRTVVEAYKAFHEIIQAANRVRFEKLSEIALVPYAKEPWYQELLDLLETRMRLDRELSPTEVGQLGKILSSTRRRMSDVELFGDNNPTGTPVTENVAEAYKKFMDQLGATSEPGLVRMAYKHITEYRGELDKYKNEWGHVKGYAPRMRQDGDWHVSAYQLDEEGRRHKVYMMPTRTEAGARRHVAEVQADLQQHLKGNYAAGANYEVAYERNTATPSELLTDRGSELAIEQLIMTAFDKASVFKTSAEDLASMKRAILDEVGKQIMAQGFGRHGISREQSQIEGYRDDDYVSVVKEFISGMAGWLSKMQYAVEVNREAERISAANPDDKVWVHDYFKDSMKNSTYLDEIAATARSVGAFYYLGFKASSALLNAFQNYTVGQAVLAGMLKKAGRKGEPILMLAKAQRDMVGFAMGKGTLTDEEQDVLRQAVRQGTAHAQAVRYISGLSEQGFGGKWKRFVEIGMTPFSWVEQYVNREPGVLAAYRAFKTTPKGQFDQKAFDLAEEFTNSSHFLMGNENLPEMVRKMGALGKTLYLFQGYVHNYLLLMANALKNGEFEVIARSLGAIAALGGVFALPGADDLDKWITKWFGVSYKLKFKLWMRRHSREYGSVGEALEAFVNYGAPSVAGVDMSRAISVNIPYIPDPQLSIGDNVLKFFGVWGGMVKKPVMAVQALGSGQYYRAIENIMPEAGANPMRAYRQATTGATTLAGKPILDETGRQMRYSGTDVAKKILGFQPMEVSQRTEMKSAERSLQDVWGDERKDHLAALRVARTREELRTAIQDVIRWNYRLHQSQAKGLVRPISAESIQRARRFTTTKADRSRMGWEQEYVD
jgi:N12 class adenine-specific DNA methylase